MVGKVVLTGHTPGILQVEPPDLLLDGMDIRERSHEHRCFG